MTLEEMAQRQPSTRSSENSEVERLTNLLTRLNEENKRNKEKVAAAEQSEQTILSLNRKIQTLTKRKNALEEELTATKDKLQTALTEQKVVYKERTSFECFLCKKDGYLTEIRKLEKANYQLNNSYSAASDSLYNARAFIIILFLSAIATSIIVLNDICRCLLYFYYALHYIGKAVVWFCGLFYDLAQYIQDETAAVIVGWVLFCAMIIICAVLLFFLLAFLYAWLEETAKKYWSWKETAFVSIAAALPIFKPHWFAMVELNTVVAFVIIYLIIVVIRLIAKARR